MKGTVTLKFSRAAEGATADVNTECDFDELDASAASCLVHSLCNVLDLDFNQRAVILHAIAAGALDDKGARRGGS